MIPGAVNLQPTVPPRPHVLKPVKKPQVPDHEVMRCIGRGSYGEVWLAQGVTGAWRAVKVVRREDFESERTFEREFQGILSFEPISRDHEGLVDILHVGRNEEDGFYFYVMELADDRESGSKINVVDYEPHTLSSDKARKVKLSLDEVVDIGIALADALSHLHGKGLSHRDIKPSNIIFVQKLAKLADIGLVAQAGQQTYVGTEGFVPPEGPGTSQADVYSLGMVLYEISTGKDRLCFPELPEDLGAAPERKRLRMLNSVICKACDPVSRRRFGSARQLSDALRQVRKGKYLRPILPRAVKLFTACGVVAFGLVAARTRELPWPPGAVATRLSAVTPGFFNRPPVATRATVRLETDPPGASVFVRGKNLGKTPVDLTDLPLGLTKFTLKLENYNNVDEERTLQPDGNLPIYADLIPAPPTGKKSWLSSRGLKFLPQRDWHESEKPVTYAQFLELMDFAPDEGLQTNAVADPTGVARVSSQDATDYCEKLLEQDVVAGRLDGEQHLYRPRTVQLPDVAAPSAEWKDHIIFHVILQRREFGDILVASEPPGAQIFEGEKLIGTTPKELKNYPTGPYEFTLRMLGYEAMKFTGSLDSSHPVVLSWPLTRSKLATLGMPFTNELGMVFMPVGDKLLVSQWETRVRDFAEFTTATGAPEHTVGWEQTPDHPVARVNREQAQKFCEWLTEKSHANGLLPEELEYRLPTDKDWSLAADLPERKLNEPSQLDKGARSNYVWGINAWPPPTEKGRQPGNFSDISRLKLGPDGKPMDKTVKREETLEKEKYDDGFPFTAPVGSFPPNRFGLYDLAGNVAEWVGENYGGKFPEHGITRGGSWNDGKSEDGGHLMLISSSRNAIKPDSKDPIYNPCGFRCVIAPKAP